MVMMSLPWLASIQALWISSEVALVGYVIWHFLSSQAAGGCWNSWEGLQRLVLAACKPGAAALNDRRSLVTRLTTFSQGWSLFLNSKATMHLSIFTKNSDWDWSQKQIACCKRALYQTKTINVNLFIMWYLSHVLLSHSSWALQGYRAYMGQALCSWYTLRESTTGI